MQEHIFRGQTAQSREWVFGVPVKHSDGDWQILSGYSNTKSLSTIDSETICQFIGMYDGTAWDELSQVEKTHFLSQLNPETGDWNTETDWKGRKVFEGDIIKYHFGEDTAVIRFGVYKSKFQLQDQDTEHCGFYADWPSGSYLRKDLGYWFNQMHAKVIGNIFDNPDLAH